jgi:hypothetical protein
MKLIGSEKEDNTNPPGNYSALSAGNTGLPINKRTKASRTGIPYFLRVDR